MELERASNIEVQFLSERLGLDGLESNPRAEMNTPASPSSIVSAEELAELARRPY